MTLHHPLALLSGVLLAGVGGELFVRGLVGIARWLRIPAGIVGATVAAFATSSPELAVAIGSAVGGRPEISLGDALGSNVSNVALILGLTLAFSPIRCPRDTIARDLPAALMVPVVIGLLSSHGGLGRLDAAVLLALFGTWLIAAVREARRQRDPTAEVLARRPALLAAGSCVGGLSCLFAAGRLIVIGAGGVARAFDVPEFVIGATVVAVGTSVPELATVVISQIRGHKAVGLGVILGSNIFNGLLVVPVAALIHPVSTTGHGVPISLIVGFLAVAITFPPRSGVLGRRRGFLLLALYVTYLVAVLE